MNDRSADEIRQKVSDAYAGRVRPVLARSNTPLIVLTPVGPNAQVSDEACCAPAEPTGEQLSNIARLYAQTDTSDLPSTVTDVAFGCGNPTAIAALRPGEVVLDLGSGGGIDCFLAAKMVGPEGRVIGVDMTPEMIELARRNAGTVGATNVEFRFGQIEALPIEDACVDVIISNCVINLSPDKDQVFREAFRVLKSGGRLQVSDIVWTHTVPDGIKDDMEQWAGCVAGALLEADYLAAIEAAGFDDVRSTATAYPERAGLASASVVAYRPAP
jgi:SAM-dependent methyltransferase